MDYDSFDGILHYIFRSTLGNTWYKPSEENIAVGVCLRIDHNNFRTFPYENPYLAPFEAAIRVLNPLVAVKVRSAAAHSALSTVPPESNFIYIDLNTRIQILDNVSYLAKADKEQCAAFIRDEHVLVVWSDGLDQIIPLCKSFDEKLMKLAWRSKTGSLTPSILTSASNSSAPSTNASNVNLTEKNKVKESGLIIATFAAEEKAALDTAEEQAALDAAEEKVALDAAAAPAPSTQSSGREWKLFGRKTPIKVSDVEKGAKRPRPARLFAPLFVGAGAGLAVFFIACGAVVPLQEWKLDHQYVHFILLTTTPFLVCITLFFALSIVTNVAMMFGPIAQYHENSLYYSALKPEPNPAVDDRLPRITVEMPVYKESLEETIAPSIHSLKNAMQTYARQGGTSAIFIHDDGLRLLKQEEQEKRIRFYDDHNIGWVARPPHSNEPDGFKRAGRFKKASNMNYGLQLSLCMEKCMMELEAGGENSDDDVTLEERALELAVQETYEATGRRWEPWACNARSLRVGDIILLVDSDTIVPEDCFRDSARELTESPEVAIIQHESDVMQVANHFFENGIAYFTRRINKCISLACANGDVAPFVGHNAFLRWSAIQDAAFVDEDGVRKIWSESNVSEDFDMALRLQLKGYIIRWANYSNGDFKEGVSLTVDDELNRWQKYSYGCNELMFHPLKDWWRKGPITKQLRTFLWSGAPVHYKLSMMSYMFSYYGIAASATLSIVNYFLLGMALEVDGYYMHSFEILLAVIVVFPGAGNVAFSVFEYRIGKKDLFSAAFENFIYVPFFWFFFGGLSLHLLTAILAHLFSYNITWGATKKEVERSNFWIEVPKIARRYWFVLTVSFLSIITMVILATPLVPAGWRISVSSWGLILPLAMSSFGHILFPIVLNPWLMIFSY